MTEYNLQALIQQALAAFIPENAAGVDAEIQINLTGDQGGNWVVTIRDQQISVEPGYTQSPQLTVGADTKDIFKLVSGTLNPMHAFMTGKVQVKGDMRLAMQLAGMFRRP